MSPKTQIGSCLIVGAGIAGLTAARRLKSNGIDVTVLEKSRGVGGRMATRRIENGVFDHGAQFITVREAAFQRLMDEWLENDVSKEWCRGFAEPNRPLEPDGWPRYCGTAGMTGIAKYMARDIKIHRKTLVAEVRNRGNYWEVKTGSRDILHTDAIILTPPIPQSLALLEAAAVDISAATQGLLERIRYDPCFAVMALLDRPSNLPEPGGLQMSGEPIAWISDNSLKGISPDGVAITIHAGPDFTRRNWDSEPKAVGESLAKVASDWIGATPKAIEVHRWRFSKPVETCPERCARLSTAAPCILAGDSFGGPRVEGAVLSGIAAAENLLNTPID